MLVDKKLIQEAQQKLGDDAAAIIAEDLNIQNWDSKSMKGCCPFHDEKTASLIWNPKNNSFHCFGCSANYNIIDHWMKKHSITFLGAVEKLFDKVGMKFNFGERGLRIHKEYRYPHYDKSDDRNAVEKYLGVRKISKETLDYCDVQQSKDGENIVFNFYDTNDVLTLVKYRPAKTLKKTDTKTWCQKNTDSKSILFNMNRIDPTKNLLIVEGEADSLSVIESGFLNCVSVPFGAGNFQWIEENWDWLEQFEKIIIWSDNDEPGIKMRRDACTRLGIYRTLYVQIPDDLLFENKRTCKDANEVLYTHGKEKILELINTAQEMPLVGAIDLSKVDDFSIEEAGGLYTHLKGIDDIVFKFLFGNVVVLTGAKGSGKSSIINQIFICESLSQGYDTFVYSGELAPPILKSWIELTMAGPEHVKMKEGSKFIHIIEKDSKLKMREWYANRIWTYNKKENTSQDILDMAVATIRKYGVKTIIIDNLSTVDLGANDHNLNEKQKLFMVDLVRLAALYNVLIILVAHPRKLQNGAELVSDDVGGSGALTNLAQYVLSVKRFSKKEKEGTKDTKGNFKKGMEPIDEDVEVNIMKNRHTGRIDTARFYFDYNSYRFWSNTKELYRRFEWDRDNKNALPTKNPRNDLPPEMRGD